MIILAVTVRPKPEKAAETLALLSTFPALAQKEKGCVQYEFFVAKDLPDTFYFFEKWADEESYQLHRKQVYLSNFRERGPELLTRPNEVVFLRPV